jgi:histidyl-tRNA synthetase
MRQRYPEELLVERHVCRVLIESGALSGFQEYDGPVLEPFSLFEAKSGGELVEKQSYWFTDRGNRKVVMRPELTPTLARMVAARGEMHLPVRWMSMPLCYRHERPQRGRVREFLQFNLDILGADPPAAELEVFLVLDRMMRTLGVSSDKYRIRWSSRRFASAALNALGVSNAAGAFAVLDRRDKTGEAEWFGMLTEAFGSDDTARSVKRLCEVQDPEDPFLADLLGECPELAEVRGFGRLLSGAGMGSAEFCPSVVRGLDYYTGIVFELTDTGGENRRALCGGGRYDNLVGMFEGRKVSGVGFGLGVLALTLFLETYGCLPEGLTPPASLFVAVFSPDELAHALKLGEEFRNRGIATVVDVSGRKVSKQFQQASRENFPWAVVVGPDEAQTGILGLKNMRSGETLRGGVDDLAVHMRENG